MKLRSTLISAGLFALVGYLFYEYGLSDEAKAAVSKTASSMKSAYININEMLQEMKGHEAEVYPLANIRQLNKEWEELGY